MHMKHRKTLSRLINFLRFSGNRSGYPLRNVPWSRRMSLDAYQQALKIGESPRQTEYRIFAQVTTELIEARDQGLAGTALVSALHRNRELWATLAADCGTPGHGLPGPKIGRASCRERGIQYG